MDGEELLMRRLSALLFVLLTSLFIFGCNNDAIDLDQIEITASDAVNIPAGTYTVEYTIEDLSALIKTRGAVVLIDVKDHSGNAVSVSGNNFTVIENEVYTVTITLSLDGETKSKVITVTAVVNTFEPVSVSFNLNGGEGVFPNQSVNYNGYAVRPSIEPTKTGYTFLGWYASIESSQHFDFETTPITQETIIYAHWQESLTETHTVTYDLNGAIVLEPITRVVNHNEYAPELNTVPVWTGYVFMGWSLDIEGINVFDLASTPVVSDMTLYAIWHIDFVVFNGNTYFSQNEVVENSTLNDGYVEQRMMLASYLELDQLETGLSITEDRVEYGILYSTINDSPTFYGESVSKVIGDDDFWFMNTSSYLSIQITTNPLLSDSHYYYVLYVRFEQTIVYSNTLEFDSLITVPTGTAVGASEVFSGGYYQIDNGTTAYRPLMMIEILDGYTATIDGQSYSSYQHLFNEGTRSLITTNTDSGNQYLHVFHIDFQVPSVVITYFEAETTQLNLIPTFTVLFPHEEEINYPISEVGVLYSFNHYYLKMGLPGVHTETASMGLENNSFTTDSGINNSGDTIYIRGYMIVNGKVSYSELVYIFEIDDQSQYQVTGSIQINSEIHLPSSPFESYFGTTSIATVYQFNGLNLVHQEYSSYLTLFTPGQYFVQYGTQNILTDVVVLSELPSIEGVIDGGVYEGSVFVSFDMYNPYWYVEYNDGYGLYLPSKIRFTVPGYYEIIYQTANGIETLSFTILG